MFEKVNPSHPDKLADRIAGALVDYAYTQQPNPRVAVEVLLGHNTASIIIETSVHFTEVFIMDTIERITGARPSLRYTEVPQDPHLAHNQSEGLRCGDNGIFRGVPMTDEQVKLAILARKLYQDFPTDGKYVIDGERLIVCQSNAATEDIERVLRDYGYTAEVNPLGEWSGGTDVDAGATNRKLGSDMGDAVTGGGIHGKDLSKADVTVNIWAHVQAQRTKEPIELSCAIGDTHVGGVPYEEMVKFAQEQISRIGGFEALAEWGFI